MIFNNNIITNGNHNQNINNNGSITRHRRRSNSSNSNQTNNDINQIITLCKIKQKGLLSENEFKIIKQTLMSKYFVNSTDNKLIEEIKSEGVRHGSV